METRSTKKLASQNPPSEMVTPDTESTLHPQTDMTRDPRTADSSRTASPTRSVISVISNTSSVTRRRRVLELKKKKAEQLAAIERKLIEDTIELEILAAEADDRLDDDDRDFDRETIQLPEVQSVTKICKKPEVQSAPYTLPNIDRPPNNDQTQTRNDDSVLNKFLTRQTCTTELPTFSGTPEDWPLFISIYNTTTRVCGYTDDENIARLVKALRGEARESVLALLVSSTNVERIVSTLQLRFGRPALIIETMLAKLRHMHDIRHDDFSQLLKYATDLQNIVATMFAIDQRGHLTNPTLIKEILCKLPSTLKYQWGIDKARRGLNDVTLQHVADWLMSVASATTDLTPTRTVNTSRFPERKPTIRQDRHPIMTTSKFDKKCHRCNGNHELAKCPDFLSLSMDERWQYVTESRLCFSCLLGKHQMKACKKKVKCKTNNCERLHHTVLHAEPVQSNDIDTSNTLIAQITLPPSSTGETTKAPVNQYVDGQPILLKVMRVVINTDKGDIETTALLDEGAAISLIDASLAARAGIDGPTKPLRICGARGMTSIDQTSKRVTFKIRGFSSDSFYTISNVRTVNNLNLPVNSMCYKNIVNKFPMLTDYFHDTDLTLDKPKLLLGQDNIDLIVTRQVIRGPKDGPMVSQTKLGYVLHGCCGRANLTEDAPIFNICSCDQLNETLKHYFKLDDFGIKRDMEDSPRSREDFKALEIMQRTTRRIGDRYETGLLWRDNAFDSPLPNSYGQAKQRLRGVDRKILKIPEFGKRYQEKIDDYLQKGYATKLTPEEVSHKTAKTWYLPHFAVFNPNKPNKLRFVLDAAAKTDGRSLNSFLMPGPDLLNPLPSVLLLFRCHQFAVMGDIREFFHQVQIVEEDRAAQRFLWGKDEYKMNVMIFGAVCSPSCAQYVKNLNAEQYRETHPRAVEAIVRRHYMDDFIDSTPTEKDAIKLIKDVTWIHETGGFTMSSIMSNSKEVLRHIPQDRLAPSAVKVISEDGEEQMIERVLGVHWNPECDNFLFKLNFHSLPEDLKTGFKKPTKREVLKVTMSVFDPLGFLLHIVMKARILLQDTWKLKIGWDDEVSTELYERWQIWLKDLKDAASIRVPRWFLTTDWDPAIPLELHIFCDASARAYVSIAYLRSGLRSGGFYVAMVMARGRVAPLKQLSIPRLELQAAVVGARIAQRLKENIDLPIDKVIFWSDSKTVLSWIRSEAGRFKPFVAHRISEIGELTQPDEWRWVPTHLNNADDATRDNSIDNSRWIHGPDFLKQAEDFWPIESNKHCELRPDDPEVSAIHLIVTKDGCLPDDNRFSKYWRLIRTTAWILRVQHNCIHKNDRRRGELLPEEMSEAEKMWIKESQKRFFSKELHSLWSNRSVDKDSFIYTLTPFLDSSGILRVNGRTQTSTVLSEDTKNPMILHPKDRFVKLLIDQYHRDAAHMEKEAVLSNTRQRFWILKGRSAVNAAWRDCQVCKNNRAKPNPPLMGQLPPERLTPTFKVFEYTGLDYFGPVTIKIGRRQEKRYVALFTCMTVRAIHIEIINDLSTNSAIMGIRRFIARRGTPKEIWSDNATAFRGADRELQTAATDMQIREFASVHRLHWRFIPPNAPHFGGCWERLIRSVKRALSTTLKERVPTEPTLYTLLLEAEYIVNSRPLTHLSLDHRDSPALTPNCFIFGVRTDSTYYPFGDFDERDLLTRTWRESQRLADLLWRRWVKEYLPTLTRRTNWYRNTEPLKVDDVVVVADDQLARGLWPKGAVTRVFVGRDGQVRVAEVKTAAGTYKRPVTKLCKLDVHVTST